MPRRTHLAVVYLRKPKNRNATILQCVVIKFRTHVNDVSDTRTNDLIHVSFGRNTSANGNAFGYEIERYGHGRMLRRRPLPVDLLEDFGALVDCYMGEFCLRQSPGDLSVPGGRASAVIALVTGCTLMVHETRLAVQSLTKEGEIWKRQQPSTGLRAF